MSQQANYFKIGLFVIGALALGATTVLYFGAGSALRPSIAVETYMDESVDGLEVGSPVKYRGVQIGRVEAIDMVSNIYLDEIKEGEVFTHGRYVYIQASIRPRAFSRGPGVDAEEALVAAIRNGLRMRMASTGATGLSTYLEADYVKAQEAPPLRIGWEPHHIYMPSATSTATRLTEFVEHLTRTFKKVDMGQVEADVRLLLAGATDAVETARAQVAAANIEELAERTGALLAHLDQAVTDADVPGLRQEAGQVFAELAETGAHANQALATLAQAVAQLQKTSARLADTVQLVDEFVRARDGEMTVTIRELRRSIEQLAEFTSEARRNPSGLLFTNPPPRVNPGDR